MQSSVPADETDVPGSEAVPEATAAGCGRDFRVMVVDDSKTIRHTAETLLGREGYDVVTAMDGFEALGMIADYRPGIIFLDVMMPRLDGYQTCALIKHHRVFRHTPVVMLSSKDGLFDRARGRVAGSDDYLTKPFTREELMRVISRYFGDARRAPESERDAP